MNRIEEGQLTLGHVLFYLQSHKNIGFLIRGFGGGGIWGSPPPHKSPPITQCPRVYLPAVQEWGPSDKLLCFRCTRGLTHRTEILRVASPSRSDSLAQGIEPCSDETTNSFLTIPCTRSAVIHTTRERIFLILYHVFLFPVTARLQARVRMNYTTPKVKSMGLSDDSRENLVITICHSTILVCVSIQVGKRRQCACLIVGAYCCPASSRITISSRVFVHAGAVDLSWNMSSIKLVHHGGDPHR